MGITLNHLIVPSTDKVASAQWFARIFGLPFNEGAVGHFAPVKINGTTTMDFADDRHPIGREHYAFHVSDAEFEEIFARVKAEGIPYGSGPSTRTDGKINTRLNGKGVYFNEINGHSLELLTRS